MIHTTFKQYLILQAEKRADAELCRRLVVLDADQCDMAILCESAESNILKPRQLCDAVQHCVGTDYSLEERSFTWDGVISNAALDRILFVCETLGINPMFGVPAIGMSTSFPSICNCFSFSIVTNCYQLLLIFCFVFLILTKIYVFPSLFFIQVYFHSIIFHICIMVK